MARVDRVKRQATELVERLAAGNASWRAMTRRVERRARRAHLHADPILGVEARLLQRVQLRVAAVGVEAEPLAEGHVLQVRCSRSDYLLSLNR